MYSREMLIEFHNEIRTAKEHMWYDHKEPDLYPILVIRWRDMEPQTVNVPLMGSLVETVKEHAEQMGVDNWVTRIPMSAPLVLWSALGAASDGVSIPGIEHTPPASTPIESIWLACEGYGLEGDDGGDGNTNDPPLQHGDLKADYENNPDSKVLERLTTYQVETGPLGTAEWGRVTSAFHKDDGGRIVWHDHIVCSSEAGIGEPLLEGSFDHLLDIMIPHVTREKLA